MTGGSGGDEVVGFENGNRVEFVFLGDFDFDEVDFGEVGDGLRGKGIGSVGAEGFEGIGEVDGGEVIGRRQLVWHFAPRL
jgi:hypothetical protein